MKIPSFPEKELPKHPYRDSAILYAVMAGAGFGFLLLTGQRAWVAAVAMSGFFVAATAWSWWRFRARLSERSTPR
jgi:hypothetical protein